MFHRVSLALFTLCAVGCATAARRPAAAEGTVTIGVTVRGTDVDTAVIRVTIDPAGLSGTVRGRSGVVTKSPVPWGDYVVHLVEVPERCQVEGRPNRPISLSPQRRSAVLQFVVTCGTP